MPHDALLDLEVTDAEYAEFGRARVVLHGLKHLTAPDGGASNHSLRARLVRSRCPRALASSSAN